MEPYIYECINPAWFLVKFLETHFLYIEVCTALDFSILSVTIQQQIQRSMGTPSLLVSLIMKSSFLPGTKWVSFWILTSKHSAGDCTVFRDRFSSGSTFCKRCFVILILSLNFWTHGKSLLVQTLDFVDFVILLLFYFDLRKCDSAVVCSIQRAFSKATYSHCTVLRCKVRKGEWQRCLMEMVSETFPQSNFSLFLCQFLGEYF